MTRRQQADLTLIIVAIGWGFSFVAMKIAFVEINQISLLIFRFSSAFAVVVVVFFKRLITRCSWQLIAHSMALGGLLYLVYVCATYGVSYTTASNAGFLVNLTVVLIPVVQYFLYREPIKPRIWISALLAIVGIYLLTTTNGLQSGLNLGDLLCILCAVFAVFHIIYTSKLSRISDPILLSVIQIGVVAVLCLVQGAIQQAVVWPQTSSVWLAIVALGIVSTAIALVVQTYAQQYTTPAHVGVIFTLEPALTTIFAYFILGEVLSPSAYLGEVLIFFGLILTELPVNALFRRNRPS